MQNSQKIHQKIRIDINRKFGIINRLPTRDKFGVINSSNIELNIPNKLYVKEHAKRI